MNLKQGMDFRLPEYRREVFQRFYQWQLKHRAHPGCVYYVMPALANMFEWNTEQKLWFAFINGCTQNPCTSLVIFDEFPEVPQGVSDLSDWFNANWHNLPFDTDRRYQKKEFPSAVWHYANVVKLAGSQAALWTDDWQQNWKTAMSLHSFGRLASFSYLEFVKIMGHGVDCPELFLKDKSGSKSHRNGLAIVLGKDEWDWKKGGFDGNYPEGAIDWLTQEACTLLSEAQERAKGQPWEKDVGYFTLESTFCTYKGWHRPNRRYPNVYNDMFHDRIKQLEEKWPDFNHPFWLIRQHSLPEYLLQEVTGLGLTRERQNHYRLTGEVIMMGYDHSCFNKEI